MSKEGKISSKKGWVPNRKAFFAIPFEKGFSNQLKVIHTCAIHFAKVIRNYLKSDYRFAMRHRLFPALYVCTYVCMNVCTCMYVCMYMYVCTYVWVCIYVWMNVHINVCMHICIYVHTYAHEQAPVNVHAHVCL